MAKKIYKIKNFSGGLNSFQTPSDISESQVSDAKSIMFTKQGSIEPSYIMTDTTNNKISAYNNATIAGVENGYGLGYFASDYSATNTATVAIDTSPAGDGCFQTLVSGNYEIDAINAGIAVNLASSFSVGSKVVLSNLTGDSETPFISEEGVYLIIAHNGNNIILDRWLAINLETSQSRW